MKNKKNFKSEYSKYIQNIKPSDDLIKKTLELANKEQERLQQSKEKSSMRFLYSINFKKLSALACTLVFAIFAVKLWSDIDKQPVPVKPNIVTDTTTDTSSTQSYVTTTIIESSNAETTSSIEVSNIDTLTDSTSYNSTCSSSCITDSSTVYNNENIYTTTPTPNDSTSTDVPNSIDDNTSTTTKITNKNNSIVNSNGYKVTTTTPKHTTVTSTMVTTPKYSDDTPSINIDIVNPTVTNATTINSNNNEDGNSMGGMTSNNPSITSTIINPSDEISSTTNPEEYIITSLENTTTSVEYTYPCNTTTTGQSNIEPEGASINRKSLVVRVSLLNVENGFFENNAIHEDRIKEYFSYGDTLLGIIPLGKTSSNNCDCLLIFDCYILERYYSDISITKIIDDLNDGIYSKIEVVNNPTNDNISQYLEFKVLNMYLDFNDDGLGAEVDIDDRNTLLSMLTIDDVSLE